MTKYRYPWSWKLSELKDPVKDAPTVFSTFACGGGSSMGYKRAGYRVVGNCEIDPTIAAVYEKNLHPPRSYVMDLRDFNKLEDLPEELYGLDVLDGSPPCSTFSMSGSREKAWGKEKKFTEGQALQTLDDLFFVYLNTVEKLKPKVSVAENVTGLIKGNAKGYVSEIIKRYKELGYEVQLFVLNAAFMGVPQRRERVFFIANRMGYKSLELDFNEKPIPFGEVRSERPGQKPIPRAAELLELYREGDGALGKAAIRQGGSGFFNHVVAEDAKVSPTLLATLGTYRLAGKSLLSVHDMKAISSWPSDYEIDRDTTVRWAFICGMSVPPSMMANIAHEIRTQWLEA